MENFSELEKAITSGGPVPIPAFLRDWLGKPKQLYIDGKWEAGDTDFPTVNPATGKELARVGAASREQVGRALVAARKAFVRGAWRGKSQAERSQALLRIAEAIETHRAPLAILESLDTGKPIRESFEGDILRSAANFRFFAEFGAKPETLVFENPGETHRAFREPLGVVALITPWNLPLYLETWKIAPALLMGNAVVLKPSELTPLTAAYFTELLEALELPVGIFTLLHGFGDNATGEFLVASPEVDAISFTGETRTGRAIMRAAAVGPTRVSFEMGGKGATVVFADADIDKAVAVAERAAFRNQGEICLACPRIFVEKPVYAEFREKFLKKAGEIVVGDPLDYRTTMGALVGRDHWKKVTGYLDRVSPGKISLGGKPPEGMDDGCFLLPTVLEEVPLDHVISREEIFGPVATLYPFTTEAEAIEGVNGTPYGLSASLWSSSSERIERVSKALHSGLVWVNCWFVRDLRVPFGGQKRSGVGREGGRHSLDFFSEWKSVCFKE